LARGGGEATALAEAARRCVVAGHAALDAVLDWFYPRHCCHCGRPVRSRRHRLLCAACSRQLSAARIEGAVCAICGLPLAVPVQAGTRCVRCRTERLHFDAARALFRYGGPAGSLVRGFKFEGEFFIGPLLMDEAVRRGWLPPELGRADAVLPVPLHPRRRRQRGYDQAMLLARALARRLRTELLSGALVRRRYTAQQASLAAVQRWDNVRGAFAVTRPERVRGRHLLLVDDVMTTGATADECARALKRAGARRVSVLTLTRTAP